MINEHYYNGIIRKYIVMFGNMFNDIDVVRFNRDGSAEQTIRVPIAYGPKEKYLARLRQDPNLDRDVATQLPRMAFEVTNFSYDPARLLSKLNRNVSTGANDSSVRAQFAPTPYDINITLYAMFANNEDAMQVVEQILPYFKPEFTHTLQLNPDMQDSWDIPTVLNDMSIEDTYDADFQSRRAIIYTFNFTVKGYIFGPVSNKGVIKRAIVDFSVDLPNDTPWNRRLATTPALLANGQPTSNSAASVPLSQIGIGDTYGVAFDSEDYFGGENLHNHGE